MRSTQKALFTILLSLLLLAGVSIVGLIVTRAYFARPLFSTITSPDGALSLRLRGDPTGPIQPIIDHSVYFDLFHKGQPVLINKYLHSGDWFDPSFNNLYRQHDWVTNSAIRFSWESVAAAKCDALVVVNHAKQRISYLNLKSRDLFLLFDLGPGSETRLCASPQSSRSSLSWLDVEGEFADGKPIPWEGTNFEIDRDGPLEYQIVITSEGARILSSQLREYRGSD